MRIVDVGGMSKVGVHVVGLFGYVWLFVWGLLGARMYEIETQKDVRDRNTKGWMRSKHKRMDGIEIQKMRDATGGMDVIQRHGLPKPA
jgi:hypothetical protein